MRFVFVRLRQGRTIQNGLRIRSGHFQRKYYIYVRVPEMTAVISGTLFSQKGAGEETSMFFAFLQFFEIHA